MDLSAAAGLLVSAWLVGALGGVHCLAMCGGFAAALRARDGKKDATAPLLPGRVIARQQATYHAGRLTTYMLLGSLFGAGGGMALQAADLLTWQRPMYALANVALLVVGIRLGMNAGGGWLQRAGASAFGNVMSRFGGVPSFPGARGRVALGLAWGLVPCALVYGALPLAMFSGGGWQGALVMLAFGLGTLPAFAASGWLLSRAKRVVRGSLPRVLAGCAIGAFALSGLYRVVAMHELVGGPFCLVP